MNYIVLNPKSNTPSLNLSNFFVLPINDWRLISGSIFGCLIAEHLVSKLVLNQTLI